MSIWQELTIYKGFWLCQKHLKIAKERENCMTMDDIKSGIKETLNSFSIAFHKFGFWILVFILCGAIGGGWIVNKYNDGQLNKAVRLRGMIVNNQVWDIEPRP